MLSYQPAKGRKKKVTDRVVGVYAYGVVARAESLSFVAPAAYVGVHGPAPSTGLEV